MNWGAKLAVAIAIFIAFMAGIVVYSFRQDLNMVTDNYYEKDLHYQDQIERKKNTQRLVDKPRATYREGDQILAIHFPMALLHAPVSGEIHLFRASDHRQDKLYRLSLDNQGAQFIDAANLIKGEWTVKLTWKDEHQEYYDEMPITIK